MVMHRVFFWYSQLEGKWHPCQVILFLLLYINQNFISCIIYNKNCAIEEQIILLLHMYFLPKSFLSNHQRVL